ncbi:uncharacterized protein LOC126853717 isoform X1 [Cataglyphis hispanica]|uniref:uncharacterized protein LOC126853717 isoform X1 n=1 Tax=Cataglyphis hispanica TaxID=1086592 RepID=UPI0021808C35|nr:uncharacterized protein LOC126853717 isoform X1 [Cataglyphis hispanica]
MKMRTRTILAACFAIVTFNKFSTANVKVSSKVDLDSDENEEALSNATFDTVAIVNESADPVGSISRASKPSTISWHHGSELVKSNEPRKRRVYLSQDNSTKRPQIINNIQIVINSNDSLPHKNSCKDSCEDSVCDVTVSSKPDGKGNIITEVHLSIITNTKPKEDAKIDDIPVIESFRGIRVDNEEKPISHPISSPNPLYSRRENIPQVTKFVCSIVRKRFKCLYFIIINLGNESFFLQYIIICRKYTFRFTRIIKDTANPGIIIDGLFNDRDRIGATMEMVAM